MHVLRTAIGLAASIIPLAAADLSVGAPKFVTHEWGTFTSVANEYGSAVEWAPLLGPADLPCFVSRWGGVYKSIARGLVRMETPVLYFYAQQPATVSVHVDFPQGSITEWYPNPAGTGSQLPGKIEWPRVQLLPGKDLAYPTTEGASHYYAARNTDATPLKIGNEQEKMIFYRGLGDFAPPLRAHFEDAEKLEIRNTGAEPIPFAVFFENQAGAMGFRVAENVGESATIKPPELTSDLAEIHQLLVSRLTGLGLYAKEAQAMVDTWADSWFTEGARVLYIVPRATVDSLLPLTIAPAPADIQRVFVGRLEVLSPRAKDTLTRAVRAGDNETLTDFGRFLEPFIAQIQRTDKNFVLSPAVQRYLRAIAAGRSADGNNYGATSNPAACVE